MSKKYSAISDTNIIAEWEENQFDKNRAVFFTVAYRTLLKEWCEFKKGRVMTVERADKIAQTQSGVYVGSLCKVYIGNTILSLWEKGECIYKRKDLYELYEEEDYSKYWL